MWEIEWLHELDEPDDDYEKPLDYDVVADGDALLDLRHYLKPLRPQCAEDYQ